MAQFLLAPLLAAGDRLRDVAGRLPQIQTRAIGTLARRLPVEARRDIQGEYNLSATRVRAGLTTRQIGGGVEVTGSGRAIGLRNFAKKAGKGYMVQVLKRDPPELFRHAFVQAAGGKAAATGAQLFQRTLEGGKRVGRTPIERLHGPTLASALRKPERRERLTTFAQQVLAAEVQRLFGVR